MASGKYSSSICLHSIHSLDENRGHLLEAGFPQEIVLLLEGYAGAIPKNVTQSKEPLPITIPHLKIVRTAIAVLLNASIGYGLFVRYYDCDCD